MATSKNYAILGASLLKTVRTVDLMNISKKLRKPLLSLISAVSVFALNMPFAQAVPWTFKVTNSGKSAISKIEVSEDGKSWGSVGGSSLKPGETSTFEWDTSTKDSICLWHIRAVYADGPSDPAPFDFCKETDLEFNG
jgi:hypothetical protein